MNTTTLVAEFILIGLLPYLTIIFAVLAIFNVHDASGLTQLKDYSTLIIFVSTLIIYLLGSLTHRLAQMLSMYFVKPLLNWVTRRKKVSDETVKELSYKSALIYQLGSDQIINRTEYNESLLRVFRSTVITTPPFGIALSFWIYGIAGWKAVIVVAVICAAITITAFFSFLMQRLNLYLWMESVREMVSKMKLK